MGRKLRIMLIEDDDKRPNVQGKLELTKLTGHLEILEDSTQDALKMWSQFIWILKNNYFPKDESDIFLIDCDFSKDIKAPSLSLDNNLDSRGILYGALLVARQLGMYPQKPFSFQLYSADSARFKDDGWAQTLIGTILAMHDSMNSDQDQYLYDVKKTVDFKKKCHDYLEVSTFGAEEAWKHALVQFRKHLFNFLRCGKFKLCSFSKNIIIKALEEKDYHLINSGLSLRWETPELESTYDEVQLISLYADIVLKMANSWSEEASNELFKDMESIIANNSDISQLFDWIKMNIDTCWERGKIKRVGMSIFDSDQASGSINTKDLVNTSFRGHTANYYYGVIACLLDRIKGSKKDVKSASALHVNFGFYPDCCKRHHEITLRREVVLRWAEAVKLIDNHLFEKPWPFKYDSTLTWIVRSWLESHDMNFDEIFPED